MRSRTRAILWGTVLAAALTGCGKGGMKKVTISGDVSYKGEPIKKGEILFYPTGDTQGPVSGALIKDGHYVTVGKGGVPVGSHRVVIRAYRVSKMVSKSAAQAQTAMEGDSEVFEQYLPVKYNEKTTLATTVEPGQGNTTKDFQLAD